MQYKEKFHSTQLHFSYLTPSLYLSEAFLKIHHYSLFNESLHLEPCKCCNRLPDWADDWLVS